MSTDAEGELQLALKFRIFDGTDIGHGNYPLSTTTDAIKERLLSEWPQDKTIIPNSVDDIRLVHAGKFLKNGKTLAESRGCVVLGEVSTMLAVVRSPEARQRADRSNEQDLCNCCCTMV